MESVPVIDYFIAVNDPKWAQIVKMILDYFPRKNDDFFPLPRLIPGGYFGGCTTLSKAMYSSST
jgi:hypothetical protein